MFSKKIKSGARIKAEKAIIEGTNIEGFLPMRKVGHLNNQEVLRNVLYEWGYAESFSKTHRRNGWVCKR